MSKIHRFVKNTETAESAGPEPAAALPVYSIEQISNYIVKGYWQDQDPDWRARSWTDKEITYDVSALSAGRQALAIRAFESWGGDLRPQLHCRVGRRPCRHHF